MKNIINIKKNGLFSLKWKSNFLLLTAPLTIITAPSQIIRGQEKRPNILFILTDDQAPWALSASGDPNAITPNMDRLLSEGAYLKNAFITTPVSSPSRASIMTSRYASEFGIMDFITDSDHKLYDSSYNPGLDPESITFAEVLKGVGYKTGLVGKWHLGNWDSSSDMKYHPTNHGFDYFMGLTGGGTSPVDPELELDGRVEKFFGLTTDILADYALKFIKDNAGGPFLLCFNTRAPHSKWLPVSEEDWRPFENMDPEIPINDNYEPGKESVKRMTREYLASTLGVDRNIGRILDTLSLLGLKNNTIIIFFSDHGYNIGHNGILGKGNATSIIKNEPFQTKNFPENRRPNMFENSIKVPAFVCWPGAIEPRMIIHNTITSLDIFPTIIEMAGANLPNNQIIRGRSIVPLLTGKEIENWNEDYYGEYSMINYCNAYMRCYRTPKWKLVRDFLNPEHDELYHLYHDPEEKYNLINNSSNEIRQVIEYLDQMIINKMKEINDPLLNEVPVEKDYYRSLFFK